MNNLYNQLNPQQRSNNSQKSLPSQRNNLFQQFLKSSNPNEFLNSLISNNPKVQSVMQLLQSSGMTPKEFFYSYAEQQGVNPDEFLSSLKGN